MATPRERLELLRKRKRLEELRALKTQSGQPTQAQAVQPQPEQIETSFLDSAIGGAEGLLALASAPVATAVSGIAGLADAANPFAPEGAGAARQKQVQEALTFTPPTREGREAIGNITSAIEPIAKNMQEFEDFIGEDALKATGSPFLASIAKTLPAATLSLLGVKQAAGVNPLRGQSTVQAASQAKSANALSKQFSKLQTPSKQKLSELIAKGSTDAETAGFKLSSNSLKSKITDGLPRIVKDKVAQSAIKQGLSPETTAMVKASSKLEKSKFNKMLQIANDSLKNRVFRANNRVGDVAGDSLLQRVTDISRIKKIAGGNLNKVAESSLKGETVNASPAMSKFVKDLEGMDITINPKNLSFKGSSIEGGASGASSAQKILSLTMERLKAVNGDAFKTHKLKRFIDKQVSFGKTSTGGAGAAERTLKNLRRELDGSLDSKFPRYKKINNVYSGVAESLDGFQKAAGARLDLSGGQANKALGVKLRSLTNNTQARANLIESMSKLEDVAVKNGIKYKDRILEQVLFADDLESLLKISPKNAFKNQIAEGVADVATGSAVVAAVRAGKNIAGKVSNINPQNAIKSIRELLKEQ
jgi:hypothetical protein